MKKLFNIDGACALRALRHLSGKNEKAVLTAAISPGMTDWHITSAAKFLKLNLKEIHTGPVEVRTFVKKYPMGTYLITTVNHAFVIENGTIVDQPILANPGTRRIINRAWRVLKPR